MVSHDDALVRVASSALEQAGFVATNIPHGEEVAEHLGTSGNPDLILVDWELPHHDGPKLCRRLREEASTAKIPIMAITGTDQVTSKVEALEAGADDCLSLPLRADELAARARALYRRVAGEEHGSRLRAGPIDMDLDRWTVRINKKPVRLTKKEFLLLQALLEAKGRVLSRATLLARAWPRSSTHGHDTRTVDVHISRLRRKLGETGRYILTVRNVGFRCDLLPEWITDGGVPAHEAQEPQESEPKRS